MERHYNITIRTDGRPAPTESDIVKAVVAAINKNDDQAEKYGPALAGYQITINTKKML